MKKIGIILAFSLMIWPCVFDFESTSVCFWSFKIRQIDRVRNFTYDSFCVVSTTKGQVIEDFQDTNDYLGTHLK